MHAHARTRAHTHTHARTHARTHACTHTHTHTYTHKARARNATNARWGRCCVVLHGKCKIKRGNALNVYAGKTAGKTLANAVVMNEEGMK